MQAVFSDYAKGCAGPQGYGMMREEEPQISPTADRPSRDMRIQKTAMSKNEKTENR